MKTESCQFPECAEIPPTISSVKTVRVVFDHRDGAPAGDRQDRIHFASDACIMNKKNRLRSTGNALFDLILIDVQRVRADVHKYGSGAAKDKGICGRRESE